MQSMSKDMQITESKHEWHLYSAVALASAVTFIGIKSSTGTDQVLAAGFATIFGAFLFAHKGWQKAHVVVHQWAIFISVLVLFGYIAISAYINRKR